MKKTKKKTKKFRYKKLKGGADSDSSRSSRSSRPSTPSQSSRSGSPSPLSSSELRKLKLERLKKKLSVKKLQKFTRKKLHREKEKKNLPSRKISVMHSFQKKLPDQNIPREVIEHIFKFNPLISPRLSYEVIPTKKNAEKIIAEYNFESRIPDIIREYFAHHYNLTYFTGASINKSRSYIPTDKEVQTRFLIHNKELNAFIKKLITPKRTDRAQRRSEVNGKLSEDNYELLFGDNPNNLLDNRPWYITLGLLKNLNDAILYEEPIDEINNILHTIYPDINENAHNILDDTNLDIFIDDYVIEKLKEKFRSLDISLQSLDMA